MIFLDSPERCLRYWSRAVGSKYPEMNKRVQEAFDNKEYGPDKRNKHRLYSQCWHEVMKLLCRHAATVQGPDFISAEYRHGGRPSGRVLTGKYVCSSSFWDFTSLELTRAAQAGKLTDEIRIGKTYAYKYKELLALKREKMARQEKKNKKQQ